jgi:fused signal recognition particle receptor
MAWSVFGSIRKGLARTRNRLGSALGGVLTGRRKVDEAFLEELEEALIASDVGPRLAVELADRVRQEFKTKQPEDGDDILALLRSEIEAGLRQHECPLIRSIEGPTVILLVGVNGTGKTTTAAKLARQFRDDGEKVLLAAADTFRAAAGEQLDIWAERLGVDVVRHPDGSDPAAVVFDACDAALAREVDVVIIDTAGRLHTKENLMRELQKIRGVAEKKIPGAPHEALLVLDATTGQNALSQAKTFTEGVGLTGLVLTKLDGTAKGGIAIAINRQVELPIKLIGVGEKAEDLLEFDPTAYVEALFAEFEIDAIEVEDDADEEPG